LFIQPGDLEVLLLQMDLAMAELMLAEEAADWMMRLERVEAAAEVEGHTLVEEEAEAVSALV